MPMYLTRFNYTPETWAMMLAQPEDRRKAAAAYIESVGGTLHGFWYAFGDRDGFTLWEAPDNVSMASVVLAIGAGGALNPVETTVLLTVEETLEALERAQSVGYRAPGATS
ncbi:GYD domain-containing protein [Blastococcus sp. CCUG 61487]|uniref:GYD domain-containing protein n=1 Tax=Blastococcus sp. CCUG 61487 TaxID=1840703 RepID=UPI0010C00503|nr:GYD domain-containing protein [Blastococcus sp. CCUG 61487]TKJ21695.1 GYD family protein [Blastococcus sp. CCUG 61487]